MGLEELYRLTPLDRIAGELADSLHSDLQSRVVRAVDIVQGEAGYVIVKQGGLWHVSNGRGSTYIVDGQTCTCPDFETVRAGLCKHRLAVKLLGMANNAPG
jgi:predicted nucleic acid-binding Zn finger protein